MFQKIAVLFDFSWPSRQALEWALHLAEHFRSSVGVLHVAFPEDNPIEVEKRIREEIRMPSKVSVHVHAGRVVDTLIAAIEADAPDLVLLGTHGQTGLLHVLLGSVAEKIVRHSPAPTLVIRKPKAWPPKNVLVPVSFEDDLYEESFLAAAELRSALGVSVETVHVTEPPFPVAYPPEAVIGLPAFDPAEALRESGERSKKIAGRHPSLPIVTHASVGQPAREICLMASGLGSDIILMPTHGHTGAARWLIGSVAEQVVRYAPCNVLTFRPGRLSGKDRGGS